jgi:gamma-glutamyltranspeptidase/glutathione hydrolase
MNPWPFAAALFLSTVSAPQAPAAPAVVSPTSKPPLHGRHWMAITGKPLGAVAGARMFERGGNAVDAACAMLAVVCTMHDDVGWGGETQALIYDPTTGKVIGINGLGVAPTGATAEHFRAMNRRYPPHEGPLAAVTPGNPGALMVMLAEYGRLSLAQVLQPAIDMADGYPIETELVRKIEKDAAKLRQWPYSKTLFFPHPGAAVETPRPGQIWRQPDLWATLRKLVEAESDALRAGRPRKAAIMAAYDRFYKGDIAAEFVRGSQEQGGLHTLADLERWRVKIEEPVHVDYKGVVVYKLTCWTQGPVLLQALNLLEGLDLKAMTYNSARYIHTLYQVMNLAFADRDFYYGDPDFPPEEPIRGLLSKAYARERARLIDWEKNDVRVGPGDPYPHEGRTNPFESYRTNWYRTRTPVAAPAQAAATSGVSVGDVAEVGPVFGAGGVDDGVGDREWKAPFHRGTTSIQAADAAGWAVSVTPSGGWLPVCIAGRTGVGMSQRMQSFVLDAAENPFNVVEPGKRPRVTLTPTLVLKDGKPFLCFSVQGGDTQDQNLLQFFLNVLEFGMTVQEAAEAANITSYQMRASFEDHKSEPGRLTIQQEVPSWVRRDLLRRGYQLDVALKNSGPITAIFFDRDHGTLWGAASDHGEDSGIAW